MPTGGVASARVTGANTGTPYAHINWSASPSGCRRRDAARHPLPGEPVGMKITPPPTPHRAPTAVGGDLSGSTATPVVSGLGGTPLDTTTPTTGDILTFDGTNWSPAAPSSTTSPLTTKGDVFGYDTADARVPVGSNGAGGSLPTAPTRRAVSWQTPSSGSGAELDYAQFTSPRQHHGHHRGHGQHDRSTGASVSYDVARPS